MYRIIFSSILLFLTACQEPEPRKVEQLGDLPLGRVRVCTQNLHRLGEKKKGKPANPKKYKSQEGFLISRIIYGKCDVVAVQEVAGRTESESAQILQRLVKNLSRRFKREYTFLLGDSRDSYIRNGFIVSKDIGEVVELDNFSKESLPKIDVRGVGGHFSRGPIGVRIDLARSNRDLYVLNFHFKSQHNHWKDPSQTRFEYLRMAMAEALRRIARREAEQGSSKDVLVVLGDRNSDTWSASSTILRGERILSDFDRPGKCVLSESGRTQCSDLESRQPYLLGLFGRLKQSNPSKYPGGSYRYKGNDTQLDEIFIREQDILMLTRSDGTTAIGTSGAFNKGSDHLMLWAELNFVD